MTRELAADRMLRCVAGLVACERRIEALLARLHAEVKDHPPAAAAFERFRDIPQDHLDRLRAHLRGLGGLSGDEQASGAPVAAGSAGDEAGIGAASRALRDAYLAFNDAALQYSALHQTAHVANSVRYAAIVQLAERHLRSYARAAQEVNQLIADVVAWELRQEGQFCECECPACDLGICWCIAHSTDAINTAWRDTAPAHPAAGLPVVPNRRRPADLDVREGDLVVAVDGHMAARTADVMTAVMSLAPGERIRFGVERRPAGTLEVTATRRG